MTCLFESPRYWKAHAVVYLAHVEQQVQTLDCKRWDAFLDQPDAQKGICGVLQDLLTGAARRGHLCRHCTAEDCLALHLNPRARAAFARALRRVLRIHARKE